MMHGLCQRRAALTTQGSFTLGGIMHFALASIPPAVLTMRGPRSTGMKMKRSYLALWSVCLVSLVAASVPASGAPKRSRLPRQQILVPSPPAKPNTFEGAEPGDDKIKIKLSEDGKVIFIAGEMVTGSYRKFARVLKGAPAVRTVHLGSPGGIVLEGYLMSALVRERKLNTYVESTCASSCTQVLVAGVDRAVAPLAKVGFHASAVVDDTDDDSAPSKLADETPIPSKTNDKNEGSASAAPDNAPPDENDDLVFKLSFVRSGVDQSFITRAFTTPHKDMWYPSIAEMVVARILTRTSTGGEISLAPGIGMSRSALDENLLEKLVWQKAKALRPAVFEASILEALRDSQIGASETETIEAAYGELRDRLSDELSSAPDIIVDRFLTLSVDQMKADPNHYFLSCGRANGLKADSKPLTMPDLEKREADVMIEIMQASTRVKAPSYRKSERMITKLLFAQKGPADLEEDAQACEDAKGLLNAIAALPQKNRAGAYRALLVFGGDEPVQ
jgi:hypothetical protein